MKYKEVDKYVRESLRSVKGLDDIKKRLNATFDGLEQCLEECGDSSIKKETTSLNNICNGLLGIIDSLNGNRRQEAHNNLFELYFKDNNQNRLRFYTVNADSCFYKMREAERFTQYLVDEGEAGMYHIPFELRHKVGNDRFGISGFPVFYLSHSAYGCWEELKRPNLDFTNVALFKSIRDMRFVNLVLPSGDKTIDNTLLLALPLVLATRLKVKHPDGNYIPEYSIPQLIMECLIESRSEENIDGKTIIGVRYESIHRSDAGLLFNELDEDDIFVNYAIPPFKQMEKGTCPIIKELFRLWNCTSWAEISYKYPSMYIANKAKTHYEESKFGIIEEYLKVHDRGMLTYRTRKKGGIPVGALTI